jgi:hypothetical protein
MPSQLWVWAKPDCSVFCLPGGHGKPLPDAPRWGWDWKAQLTGTSLSWASQAPKKEESDLDRGWRELRKLQPGPWQAGGVHSAQDRGWPFLSASPLHPAPWFLMSHPVCLLFLLLPLLSTLLESTPAALRTMDYETPPSCLTAGTLSCLLAFPGYDSEVNDQHPGMS